MNFTLEQVMSIVGSVVALLGQAWLTIRYLLGKQENVETRMRGELAIQTTARDAAVSELHRRIDSSTRDQSDFREHVAKTYATVEFLRDVEKRITEALIASENRITAHLDKIDRRLERGQHGAE